MTAKVGPAESNQNWDRLRTQRRGSNNRRVSRVIIQHHNEAVYMDTDYVGYGSAKRNKEVAGIQKHIKMRKCSYYKPTEDKNICQCGYYKIDHELTALKRRQREVESSTVEFKWDFLTHTQLAPTNAFGEIESVGFGGNIGKFVRVDRWADKYTMLYLMMNVWQMEKPNLLISVTGGTKSFNMKPRLRDVFRSGLVKGAHSTGLCKFITHLVSGYVSFWRGPASHVHPELWPSDWFPWQWCGVQPGAWIITGGTHNGVTRHVGEAVKDYGLTSKNHNPVAAIGIAPWGIIRNGNVLISNEVACPGHMQYNILKQGSWPARYRTEEHLNPEESFLDPYHGHFFLVDNGTQHKFSTEIPFRAELEQEISEMQTDTGDG